MVHRVVALAVPDVVAFDLATPAQVFGHRDERARYSFVVASDAGPGPVATTTGFGLLATAGLDALAAADTVIVPGFEPAERSPRLAALDALRGAHARGARIASICTGAFALGRAGLLAGRRATTHWRNAARLAELFPTVAVDPTVLWIDEGDVLTSAGVAAGIDLCLHLVRSDRGAEAANRVARRMVVAPHRSGGQAQFVERPVPTRDTASLAATRVWMLEGIAEPLEVAAMADHAGWSTRSFARRFRAETGSSPLQWLIAQRVLHARHLLEATDLAVEQIARRCGFGSSTGLREHFARATATMPGAYRATFRDPARRTGGRGDTRPSVWNRRPSVWNPRREPGGRDGFPH